ncbi:MAG: hypothetical protein IT158_26270 [Bryobacterales bacterium]|nr:hypothetical protein [Bryobacterales bacterium]
MPRQDHEPPDAIARYGWRFHHVGIPTSTPRPGERSLPEYRLYVQGFDTSPYGIEWMRFEPGSPVSELIRTVPHVAFEVDDLEDALARLGVRAEISSPARGVRAAMFEHNGAPVELIEFRRRQGPAG